MKKMLLIGVAASSMMLAIHAHADTALPNQMLGDWCYSKAQRGYVRQRCGDNSALVVRRDGFVTIDVKCRFDRVEPRANGVYLVRSTCTDGEEEDDRGPPYTESQEYRIAGKTLMVVRTREKPPGALELSKADPMIGEWCPAKSGAWTATDTYLRTTDATCSDTSLKIRRNGYAGLEWGCDFYEVKRLQTNDGYAVSAECGGEGTFWNERAEFKIVGKSLSYRIVARTDSVNEGNNDGSTSCAVVTNDNIPDEGRGRFLNLRAGPGTEFPVKTKLIPGDRLEVDATKDGWKHVTSSARVKADGWVRDKFLVVFPCSGAPDAEPAAQASPVPVPAPTPGDRIYQAYAQYDYLTRYCAASFNDDDLARAHAAVKAVERVTMKTGASLSDAWMAAKRCNDGVPGNRCKENFQSLMENGLKP